MNINDISEIINNRLKYSSTIFLETKNIAIEIYKLHLQSEINLLLRVAKDNTQIELIDKNLRDELNLLEKNNMNEQLIDKVKEVMRTTDINYNPYYNVLPKLINERGYNYGIEIGVFCGGHVKSILSKTNAELVIGIDPYKEYPKEDINMGTIVSQQEYDILLDLVMEMLPNDRFKLIRKTSDDALSDVAKFAFHNFSYPSVPYKSFDWIFFDGKHTAEQLTKDIQNYVPLIQKGGIIAFHDFNHPTFPELTSVICHFVKEHNTELQIEPLHLVWIEKNW